MKCSRLFQPIEINGMSLKNRLVMPAMHTGYAKGGYATERFDECYWRIAEGGVGLIMVGGCALDNYAGYPDMMDLSDDIYIESYKKFTDGIHARGAKVAVQLMQTGRYGQKAFVKGDNSTIAPSAVYSTYSRETPREMTKEEIKTTIRNWAAAAVRAKKASFDAVESTGASGYLISQFLSPVTNLRTDEYGGSFENRCRFPLELVAALREAVGPDYPLIMRVAGNEFMKGGNTNEECVEFCKLLEKAGIDMINVTGGWHETAVPQLPAIVPRGEYAYLAEAVKDAVSIPVLSCNRYNDPHVAERVLALGQADLIGVGRPLVADPDYPVKAMEGRFDEIRTCVGCNQGCLGRVFFGKPSECLVNGRAGREYLFKNVPAAEKKRLAVIGAGPAGCEFAIRAAESGHEVTLYEKESAIGGKLPLASVLLSKREFAELIRYYKVTLEKRGVRVILNHCVTEEELKYLDADAIIVAAGSEPKQLEFPAMEHTVVCTAEDILSGEVMAGRNAVVLGGGAIGCEAAEYMAHEASLSPEQLYFKMSQRSEKPEKIVGMLNSSRRNVAIVDIVRIGNGYDPGCFWPVLGDLKRLGVKMFAWSNAEIADGSVTITTTDKKTGEVSKTVLPCDTLVTAVGYKSNNSLYESLKEAGATVYQIGDAKEIGKVLDAVRQANNLIAAIDGYEIPLP